MGNRTIREYGTSVGFILKLMDAGAILTGGFLSYFWRFEENSIEAIYLYSFVLSIFVFELFLTYLGAYQNWRNSSITREIRTVITAAGLAFLILLTVAFFTHTFLLLPRIWIAVWFVSTILLTVGLRLCLRGYLRRSTAQGNNIERILIVGNGRLGRSVAEKLLAMPASGLKPVGFISEQHNDHSVLATLGKVDELNEIIAKEDINQVWVALPMTEVDTLKAVQAALATSLTTIRMVPDLYGFHLINHSVSDIAGMPVINLSSSPMLEGKNRFMKRVEDVVFSSLILLMISPIMIGLALAVKLTSPGPIFYRQERVSWNGKPFDMLKFRSMAVDSEKDGVKWGGSSTMSVTPIGKFIRRTSLDELPQFINVLLGDMSIVGPRPERTIFVDQFKHEIPGYMQKHLVKAGITGWAQINGWRGDTDLKKRIECDLYYIENWSVWLDLKIIVLTVFKGFIHKNAN